MGPILMTVRIEDAGDGRYRGIYGAPRKGFGSEQLFDTLEDALRWANGDGSAALLIVTDT
jgi:hypothetical protein